MILKHPKPQDFHKRGGGTLDEVSLALMQNKI